ncbi:MAG: BT_2262 family domain-containing protein [Candidatus Cryptobacteroides sp.]
MKKFIYTILSLFAVCVITSCSKKEESRTWITAYPSLDLLGEKVCFINLNSDFDDPGCKATLEGSDVSDQVVANSDLDITRCGKYSIVYSITNVDGFSASASRTVYVYDFSDPMMGQYISQAGTKRTLSGNDVPYSGFDVIIYGDNDGGYILDDLFAGFYAVGRGYGSSYCMTGWLTLNPDGTLTLEDSYVPGWGDGFTASKFTGNFDSATGVLSYVGYYEPESLEGDAMIFTVILKK